ncbi:MAG: LysM peptidoglycan-binding domain-containing protein [Saprospiraceae bacterium]|nr:LysM peptidoglycan-binding domain-containing protein [Saprospiraceae bacterium]
MRNALPGVLLIFLPAFCLAQTPEATLDSIWSEYIRKYKDIAMDEMERSGVPASIKLAQGILESRGGTSELAAKANNHFGIKCGKGWRGPSYSKNDDERNKKGERVHSCFRKYNSVVECFADHSEFIRNPEKKHRYGFLFELDVRDYKAWAQGLQDAGYSSVNYYAEKLIFFIERYRLYELDWLAHNGRIALKRLAQVNDVKMIQARDGETLRDIAGLYNLPVEQLLAFNEQHYTADQAPGLGAWVFVQTKRDKWNGPAVFHAVGAEQSLFDIAQLYGIQLDKLRQRNGLKPKEEPAPGAHIRLSGKRAGGEKIPLRSSADTTLANAEPEPVPLEPEPELAASDAFIIEMLPEEYLFTPVPVSWPAADLDANEAVLLDEPTDPAPAITVNMSTGETELYYTVSKGDTLYSIARKHRISTSRLRQLNRMKDSNIKAGQILRVN